MFRSTARPTTLAEMAVTASEIARWLRSQLSSAAAVCRADLGLQRSRCRGRSRGTCNHPQRTRVSDRDGMRSQSAPPPAVLADSTAVCLASLTPQPGTVLPVGRVTDLRPDYHGGGECHRDNRRPGEQHWDGRAHRDLRLSRRARGFTVWLGRTSTTTGRRRTGCGRNPWNCIGCAIPWVYLRVSCAARATPAYRKNPATSPR